MERTLTKDCKKKIGKKVLVKGWMYQLRELGKINFIILWDRSGYIQIVVQDKKEIAKLKNLHIGTVLGVTGEVKKSAQTELGVEIANSQLEVLSPVHEAPPIEYNKESIKANQNTILNYRPLSIRNEKIRSVFRVQATIMEAFRDSLRSQEFVEFRCPVLMGSPSEGGADVFEVKYFDRSAYLAQSPQLYKQIMLGAYERVFTLLPVFRAEKHHTSRHLTEITHMDAEMAFVEDMDDVFVVVEQVVRDIFGAIEKRNSKDLKRWNVSLPKLPKGRFPRIKIREVLEIVEKRTGKSAKGKKLDLEPEDEREIGKWAMEEHDTDFLWVTNFFKDKNFYTWNNPDDPSESQSYDLICRGIEWLSGTIRIEKYEKLIENIKKQSLNVDQFEGYLQAFKYGMPPEAGFSFGLERITQKIFDFDNIRSATLFPRDVERLTP